MAYALMARRSELVALNLENFSFDPDGSAKVTFERIKTGEISTSYLPAETVTILRTWLDPVRIDTLQAHRPHARPHRTRPLPDQ